MSDLPVVVVLPSVAPAAVTPTAIMSPATPTNTGSMSAVDKIKLNTMLAVAASPAPSDLRALLYDATGGILVYKHTQPNSSVYLSNQASLNGVDVTQGLIDAMAEARSRAGANRGGEVIVDAIQAYMTAPFRILTSTLSNGMRVCGQLRGTTGTGITTHFECRLAPLAGTGFTISNVNVGANTCRVTGLAPGSGAIDQYVINKWIRLKIGGMVYGWFKILVVVSATALDVELVNEEGETLVGGAYAGTTWSLAHQVCVDLRTRDAVIEGISLRIPPANPLDSYQAHAYLNVTQEPGEAVITQNRIINCRFGGDVTDGTVHHSVVLGDRSGNYSGFLNNDPYPSQNDYHSWYRCSLGYARHSIIYSPNTTGQGKSYKFEDTGFSGGGDPTYRSTQTLYGMWLRASSIKVCGNSGGGNFRSWMFALIQPDDESSIVDFNLENSARLLYTGGYASSFTVSIERGRYDATTKLPVDGVYCSLNSMGSTRFVGVAFDVTRTANFKIEYGLNGLNGQSPTVTAIDCDFPNEHPFSLRNGSDPGRLKVIDCFGVYSDGNVYPIKDVTDNPPTNYWDVTRANMEHGVQGQTLGLDVPQHADIDLTNFTGLGCDTIELLGYLRLSHPITISFPAARTFKRTYSTTNLYGPTAARITLKTTDASSVGLTQRQGTRHRVMTSPGQWVELVDEFAESSHDWRPDDDAQLAVWIDACQADVDNGTFPPNTFPDGSSHARNATVQGAFASGDALLPDPKGGGVGTQIPSIQLASLAANYILPAFALPQPYAMYFAFQVGTMQNRPIVYSADLKIQVGNTGKLRVDAGAGLTDGPTFANTSDWVIVEIVLNGASSTVRIFGTGYNGAPTTFNPGASGLVAALRIGGDGAGNYMYGQFLELFLSGDVTTATKNKHVAYLRRKHRQ